MLWTLSRGVSCASRLVWQHDSIQPTLDGSARAHSSKHVQSDAAVPKLRAVLITLQGREFQGVYRPCRGEACTCQEAAVFWCDMPVT